jgi:hypothetical protein
MFLGTPHHGAGLAILKQTNPKVVEVLRRDSEVLARIQDSFHTMVIARGKEGLRPIDIRGLSPPITAWLGYQLLPFILIPELFF